MSVHSFDVVQAPARRTGDPLARISLDNTRLPIRRCRKVTRHQSSEKISNSDRARSTVGSLSPERREALATLKHVITIRRVVNPHFL